MGPAAQPQQVDFGAMFAKLARSDMIIGGALLLLLIFSFFTGWFHASLDVCQGITSAVVSCSYSRTYGSLWGGLGILAALLIVAAIVFLVLRLFLSDQVQLPELPLSDAQVWMAFGVVEIVLIFLNWLIGKGSFEGVDLPDAASKSPGWTLYVGVILCLAIIFGGYTKQTEPQTVTSTRGLTPPPMPPSPPTTPMAPPPPPPPPPAMNA